MTALARHVEAYLATRRALGFKLEAAGRLLTDFAAFAARAGVETVTVEVALAWAGLPTAGSPVWINQRLGVVRQFARYLATADPHAEVPPTDLLPGRARRATPYLYSEADIAALISAARKLPGPLRAATFATLIGLLTATGMRGGGDEPGPDRHRLRPATPDRASGQVRQVTSASPARQHRDGLTRVRPAA